MERTREFWLAGSLFTFSSLLALVQLKRYKENKPETLSVQNRYVSPRGSAALTPPIPYLKQFFACLQDPCDHVYNRKGYIALCVAENKLVLDLVSERFSQSATTAFADINVYCYDSFVGMPILRKAVAYFLARRFLYSDIEVNITPEQALEVVQPKCIGIAAGAAAILSHLFFILGEQGEACLIPAPYYAAFENDMKVVAGIEPVAILQADPVAGPTEEELNKAFHEAQKRGHRPKFIIITNPNNPLGTIYKPEVLLRIINWARDKKMHAIVDEIYALSTHKKHGHSFQSIIKVLDNDLREDVHMVWALSKDFAGSGLRAGVVYSQNETFMEALATLNIFSCVSGPLQYLVAEILTDNAFVNRFLDESRVRIVKSYKICIAKLQEMVIPYIPAEAALFVYVDFSSLLPEKTHEWEAKLSEILFCFARIVPTPGASQRDANPGMFRICYAWVSPDVLEIAMERLSKIVGKIRRLGWSDLNETTLSGVL